MVAWSKAVRDVWRSRTRAALVVLAIAIGLSGFLAVLSTYASPATRVRTTVLFK